MPGFEIVYQNCISSLRYKIEIVLHLPSIRLLYNFHTVCMCAVVLHVGRFYSYTSVLMHSETCSVHKFSNVQAWQAAGCGLSLLHGIGRACLHCIEQLRKTVEMTQMKNNLIYGSTTALPSVASVVLHCNQLQYKILSTSQQTCIASCDAVLVISSPGSCTCHNIICMKPHDLFQSKNQHSQIVEFTK